jgi:hypothetical protein
VSGVVDPRALAYSGSKVGYGDDMFCPTASANWDSGSRLRLGG